MEEMHIYLSPKQINDLEHGIIIDIKNKFGQKIREVVIWAKNKDCQYEMV